VVSQFCVHCVKNHGIRPLTVFMLLLHTFLVMGTSQIRLVFLAIFIKLVLSHAVVLAYPSVFAVA